MARPRKPTALMEASGAFDRDPARRRVDPATSGELGNPPKHLQADRVKIWREIAKNLPQGVARNADRIAFEVLVELTYQFRYQSITGAQLSNMTGLLHRFGLTPASRANVAAPVSTKAEDNPFLNFAP